jgi:hypothetical protein
LNRADHQDNAYEKHTQHAQRDNARTGKREPIIRITLTRSTPAIPMSR